jgi:coenzyme F420-reducing hydrogenase delta subunit
MCSGRVDPGFVLRAFSNGTDAVFIGGCHINDCHYVTEGNYDAYAMVQILKKLLDHIGIDPARLRLEWVSAGEGIRFAEIMNEYGAQVKEMGPLGKLRGITKNALKPKIEAISQLLPYIKLVERERLRAPKRTEEAYNKYYASEEFNRLFKELIADKLSQSDIMTLLREQPLSTGKIAEALGMTPSEVARHMNATAKHGLVRYDAELKSYAIA